MSAVLDIWRAQVRVRAAIGSVTRTVDITSRALRVALESPLLLDACGDLLLEFAHLRLELADHINHTLIQTKTSQMEENVKVGMEERKGKRGLGIEWNRNE